MMADMKAELRMRQRWQRENQVRIAELRKALSEIYRVELKREGLA
jgi:hypothetical protein